MIALPPPPHRGHPTRTRWVAHRRTRWQVARDTLAAITFDQWLMLACASVAVAMLARCVVALAS